MALILHYFTEFGSFSGGQAVEDMPKLSATEM